MSPLHQMETVANTAVRNLRVKKLKSGLPFMINSKDLPTNQCYLEYPNGTILLVSLKGQDRNFTTIRELSKAESKTILQKYNLAL